ncbi:hypothetical protein L211DRAFT_852938 [Terfezia boudieri ATCC MYA-4762]|uniref:Uncharacterized protein n=1 Tax=Terfezia boudieri ATCC MYA-4762 TaxID=1051890 RepID=A0A3N4LP43_9PEZI|nr:hypothetical protein L211DRAFT_852938 [Terfezia boudieri ATCC MYA-4762]
MAEREADSSEEVQQLGHPRSPVVLPGIQHLCDPWFSPPARQPLDPPRSTSLSLAPTIRQPVVDSRTLTLPPLLQYSDESSSRPQLISPVQKKSNRATLGEVTADHEDHDTMAGCEIPPKARSP